MAQNTATCESFAPNTMVGRCVHFTRSILVAVSFCSSEGDKTGNDRWYDTHIPIADQLYDEHLTQLRMEGLING